ncbi:MAG: hypothetical protein ACOCU2_03005 [Bacillota bacterium]
MNKEKTKPHDSLLNQDQTETYLKDKARREKEYNAKLKFKQKVDRDDDDLSYKLRKTRKK